MNKIAIILTILVVATLAMGLPYLLRRGSAPTPVQAPAPPGTPPAPAPSTSEPAPVPTPAPAPTPSPVPASPQQPASKTPVSVTISNFTFMPANLTIKKGTVVTWTNTDDIQHTVTADVSGPASPFLSKGSTYSFTFDTAGNFSYHCKPHPSMRGRIEVTN